MEVADPQPTTASLKLVENLIGFTEARCQSRFQDFSERLEMESIEYGVSEETLTEIFLKSGNGTRDHMLKWFVIANLAVGSVYFLGRHNKALIREILGELRRSVLGRYEKFLGEDACHPLDSVNRILQEGAFDAYQAGALTFLTQIGYLDHQDATEATLDPEFLKKFRLDFSNAIPYLHEQASQILSGIQTSAPSEAN